MITSLIFLFSIIFLSIIIKLLLPKIKGIVGEKTIHNILKKDLDEKKYIIIPDVTLSKDSDTTQIDFIVLSIYGILVIEVKNYKGWIYGSGNQKQWTQTIYKKKHKFQNPLHQNYKHIKFLVNLLNIDIEHLKNVVVFTGDSEFKSKLPSNICTEKTLIEYLIQLKKPIFSLIEVKKYQN